MLVVNMHNAKTQLSKLVDMAAKGQPFIIAKAGKPMVRVEGLKGAADPNPPLRALGALKGVMPPVPDDFDTMFQDEIAEMFYGKK